MAAAAGSDEMSPVEDVIENPDAMTKELENFYESSKNKFLLALFNLSAYLP